LQQDVTVVEGQGPVGEDLPHLVALSGHDDHVMRPSSTHGQLDGRE